MDYNFKNILKISLNAFITILLIVIIGRIFIYLLPIIILLFIAYYIYRWFKDKSNSRVSNNNSNSKKNNSNAKKIKNIKDNIVDADIIEERFN